MMQSIDHQLIEYKPHMPLSEERENYQRYVEAFEQYRNGVYKVLLLAPTLDRATAMSLLVEQLSPEAKPA